MSKLTEMNTEPCLTNSYLKKRYFAFESKRVHLMKKRKKIERDMNDFNFIGSRKQHYCHYHHLKQ